MTLQDLDQRLGEAELIIWQCFDELKGLPRSWYQVGRLCSVIHNSSLGCENPRPPIDFMPEGLIVQAD